MKYIVPCKVGLGNVNSYWAAFRFFTSKFQVWKFSQVSIGQLFMHYLLTWMMSIMLASSSPSGSLCINTAPHLLRGGVEASRKRGLPPSPQGLPLWSAESSSCNQDIRIMKNIEILGKYWIYTQNSTWRTKLKFSNLDTFPCWILSIYSIMTF